MKSNQCPKSVRNIRRLVDESFVPATQRTSVLHCRLSNLKAEPPSFQVFFLCVRVLPKALEAR